MALVLGPVVKIGAVWLMTQLFKPRASGAGESGPTPPLDTSPLDAIAQTPPPSSAPAQTSSASVPVAPQEPVAPVSASELAQLTAPAEPAAPVDTGPASGSIGSQAQVPAHWRPVSAGELAQLTAPAEVDGGAIAPLTAAEEREAMAGAASAARALHAYIMSTPSARRDRTRVRTLQAAIGGVTVDGLIGRETAARIRELTGLRIPGLS